MSPAGALDSISSDTTGKSPEVTISYSLLSVDQNNPGANDSNRYCAASAPCLTIMGAVRKNLPGANILVAPGTYCEQDTVDVSLTLAAANAGQPPKIDGGAGSGNPCAQGANPEIPGHSVLTVGDGSTHVVVTVQGVSIQNGDASGGPNGSNASAYLGYGGGVYVYAGARLSLANSSVSGNSACTTGCAGNFAAGGGIYNGGATTLMDSVVSGNTTCAKITCSNDVGGGGIVNSGTMTLLDSTVTGNVGCSVACGTAYGGGIDNEGTMALLESTVSGDTGCAAACGTGYGGGINSTGPLALTNSTVANNYGCNVGATSCTGSGGGIYEIYTTTLTNSTVSGNAACFEGSSCDGGGLVAAFWASLTNSIVAQNSAPNEPDCEGYLEDSKPDGVHTTGHNIIGIDDPASPCGLQNNVNGDQVGTATLPINPRLGSLAANGGVTQTMGLLFGSPAIDHGDAATCQAPTIHDASGSADPGPSNLDQRGYPRHADSGSRGACDIGAFDTGGPPAAPTSLTATPGSGEMSLSWQAPGTSGGNPPFTYSVGWDCTANPSCADAGSETVSTTSATVTGLTNGTEYTFSVRAVNATGPGSAAATNATPGGVTVARVVRFSAHRSGRHVTFRWRMASQTGVAGFNLYSGTHKLNRRMIRVRGDATYRAVTARRGTGPFTLHITLVNGRQEEVGAT